MLQFSFSKVTLGHFENEIILLMSQKQESD